jgi:hypothetical protein
MSTEQTLIIGLAASVLVFVINEMSKNRGIVLQRARLTVILFIVAVALTVLFTPLALPALPAGGGDPAASAAAWVSWLGSVLLIVTQVVGASTAIYNILLKKVFEQLNGQWIADYPSDTEPM